MYTFSSNSGRRPSFVPLFNARLRSRSAFFYSFRTFSAVLAASFAFLLSTTLDNVKYSAGVFLWSWKFFSRLACPHCVFSGPQPVIMILLTLFVLLTRIFASLMLVTGSFAAAKVFFKTVESVTVGVPGAICNVFIAPVHSFHSFQETIAPPHRTCPENKSSFATILFYGSLTYCCSPWCYCKPIQQPPDWPDHSACQMLHIFARGLYMSVNSLLKSC